MSITVSQEIDLFAQCIAIIDSTLVKNESTEQKRKQAITRLKSKVTIADATRALEDATKRGNDDDRKAAERALSALMDAIPQDAALEMLKKGLSSSDPKLRASSIAKIVSGGVIPADVVSLMAKRCMDVDTQVAKLAT